MIRPQRVWGVCVCGRGGGGGVLFGGGGGGTAICFRPAGPRPRPGPKAQALGLGYKWGGGIGLTLHPIPLGNTGKFNSILKRGPNPLP